MKTVYVCADTVTGIFSAVYDAWKSGRTEEECGIALRGFLEQELFCDYVETAEMPRKAAAVEKLILRHLGAGAYHDIYHALLAPDGDKADAVLGTMLAARKIADSRRIMEYLSHTKVARVFELSRTVANEAHCMIEFLRFRELEGGILYSPITPKSRLLTCIAPHFSDRFPLENWVIHDRTHGEFAVHKAGRQWIILERGAEEGEEERAGPEQFSDRISDRIPDQIFDRISEDELAYEQLWKNFCETIAIRERYNPKCQMTQLPLRYRPDMVEFL